MLRFQSLCGGSITAFSLYGHLFLSRLRYTQLQVNAVSITVELSSYLVIPLVGYVCDRYNPGLLSLLSSFLFGTGYLLAAICYQRGPPVEVGGHGWPHIVMILAFIGIGMGTSCMYISAVTTCAKNFGRGKHKGLALGLPIAGFGVSSMWQSQFASQFLAEKGLDGGRGDIDVFKFFLFLSILLFTVGLIGALGLQIVDEEELIDEAVEELERSGLLDDSHLFRSTTVESNYGTMGNSQLLDGDLEGMGSRNITNEEEAAEEIEKRKKTWLLNTETSRFLSDHTMWWLAAGFLLVTGPGEAFINNVRTHISNPTTTFHLLINPQLGTVMGSLETPPHNSSTSTTPATQISIVALTSTLARILTGTLTDILSPSPSSPRSKFRVSRVTLLLLGALLLSLGQVLLASGLAQSHPERFGVISALIGTSYGVTFSLVPIIISVIWGVENFGTNWGIVILMPAFGATCWALVYSWVYQSAASSAAATTNPAARNPHGDGWKRTANDERLCFGKECYAPTFWGMAASVWLACAFWLYAWRGPGGWRKRGILV